jgi:4-aminobutyrate aminotransferase-like enzyme
MLAIEVVDGPAGRPSAETCAAVISAARERGLILLACGLDSNVIRLLPPITIDDEDLERGLGILEDALR